MRSGARPTAPGGRARPAVDAKPQGEVGADVLQKLHAAGLLRKDVKVPETTAPRPARAGGETREPRNLGRAAEPRKPARRAESRGADGRGADSRGGEGRGFGRGAASATKDGAAAKEKPKSARTAKVSKGQAGFEAAYGEQRLQKVMAQAGLASRRHSEDLISAGRVKVNGEVVTQLGTKVVPGRDVVEVDNRPLGTPEELLYIILNKPKGYVTTLHDPQGRPKVVDLLGDVGGRVYPVGRLDYDTEGLLLLSNDGELAHALMHPTMHVTKTYIGRVRGVPGAEKLRMLERGIELDDGTTAPARVKVIDVKGPALSTVSIVIHEGRNRQVRRMLAAVGHEVIHLSRTTLGPLNLKGLEVGQWRYLTQHEVNEVRQSARLRAESRVAPVAAAPPGVQESEGNKRRSRFLPGKAPQGDITQVAAQMGLARAAGPKGLRPSFGGPSRPSGPSRPLRTGIGRPSSAGRPGEGGDGRPDAVGAGRPGAGRFGRPGAGGAGRPGAGGVGRPGAGGAGRPGAGGFGRPGAGGVDREGAGLTSRPSRPGAGGAGRPGAGGAGRPGAGGAGRPGAGGAGRPAAARGPRGPVGAPRANRGQ